MNGNPKPIKGTTHSTARLDVAMFVRRWRRLIGQGKATEDVRIIRRGEGQTILTVGQLESILEQAEGYQAIVQIMQKHGKKPIERYAEIRGLIQIIDTEDFHGRQRR